MSTTPDEHDEPEPVPGSEPTEPGPAAESGPEAEPGPSIGPSNLYEVEESAPDGGTPAGEVAVPDDDDEEGEEDQDEDEPVPASVEARADEVESGVSEAREQLDRDEVDDEDDDDDDDDDDEPLGQGVAAVVDDDDEPPPELVWYVLKVQSGREDTIRDALERRVKIQDLGRFFGAIVVPKEKVTEIRNNKKRTVDRKSYPGYIMVQMELNEKTWFVVRETPGVGDFVGAHGTPTPMSQTEIDRILKPEEPGETKAVPKIDLERGDRVKIKEGPFENFEGNVEEVIEARGLVKVMLIIFNRPTPVDLEYWQVERV
jgi:transcriptional antiterminator NusG